MITTDESSVMVSLSLLRSAGRQELQVSSRRAFKASGVSSKILRRWIGLKYLAKVAEAEKQWQEQAAEIRAGRKKSMLTVLEERGLVHQITGYTSLRYSNRPVC